jgi:excinuclease ABC subunit C
VELDDREVLIDWLSATRGRKVKIIHPMRGPKTRLVSLANKNAAASAASRRSLDADRLAALDKLQQRLSLKRVPRRIECFDIAHIQGAATVASMVVFIDGQADRSLYRKFKVKSVTNDDFAAMYEVLTRRFRRGLASASGNSGDQGNAQGSGDQGNAQGGDSGWSIPDLLVVDGGKGQLNQALTALADLGIEITAEKGFDVIGLAKERDDAAGASQPDRVFLRNRKDPIKLRPNTTELYLLARIRDEAHRFANTFHRDTRKRTTLRSALDDIAGIGSKRRRQLLRHFGSLKAIRAASVDDMTQVAGMSRKAAEAVYRYFRQAENPAETSTEASTEPATE